MDKKLIEESIHEYLNSSPLNTVSETAALDKSAVGMKLFDDPLIGYASAEDDYFRELAENGETDIDFALPIVWHEDARTVISFFLPFTEAVRKSNIQVGNVYDRLPSVEWLHGRIEGQNLINHLLMHLVEILHDSGYGATAPTLDDRFISEGKGSHEQKAYGSNWSERHVAYTAGLGTFSLSGGLITKKGVAGRFGSVVTSLKLEPSVPGYDGLTDYCIMCGSCAKKCPVGAISINNGKSHKPCSLWLDGIYEQNRPYYGCGKCQTGVPCESRNPSEI